VPDRSAFGYTFDHLADVVDGLLDQLGIGTFAIYVMDFGAPVGFRLALRHPERLSAIIAQNAPLHPWEPRGWWATLGQYWADGSAAHRQASRSYLDRDGLRGQYLSGVQDPSRIDPDNWVIDKALIDRPGAEYHALPTGHFALEDKAAEIAALMRDFLARTVPRA
jgi:pimeloyl-ACP methyl ester carboxylesterase